jgi:eukaryotic-like serine/threonine-protein kinase
MGIFSELRQRRLFQIVATYLAGGWVALQLMDQLTQQGILPEVLYELLLIWYLAGIPAAVLVGWNHGEKGKQKAPLSEVVALGVLGLVLVVFTGMSVSTHIEQRAAVAAAEASALDLRRMAVLYFEDFTPGGGHQHLADGLTESLIDELASVRGLDVISRNGVAQYRGADLPPDSIARALKAGILVRGEVQQVRDRLRVTVALLEGQSGVPLSRRVTVDRPAEDVFAVRDEVAAEVSRMLRESLREEVRIRRTRTETSNSAAWILFQRAERERKDGEDAIRHHDGHAALASFARADSLLDQVELLDASWDAPILLRAELQYRRARLSHDRHERVRLADAGVRQVNRILTREPRQARALALRGTLRYYQYLQHLIPDERQAAALRQSARQDLELAVEIDPSQAIAWSALQHMYYGESLPDAVMAGRRAYEEDAYLEAADEILWRLYTGHYDLANFANARGVCEEGARRFPQSDRFVTCQLELMHTTAYPAEPDRAWALAARVDSLAAPHRRDYARVQSKVFVAGALVRANLPDSARAVLRRAERDMAADIDPSRELLTVAAAVWSMVGDQDHAIDLLKRHQAANPHASFDHHWWYRTIRSHPRYGEISNGTHRANH